MRRQIILCACAIAFFLSGNPVTTAPLPFGPSASKTDVAMTLSVGELKHLVARCVKTIVRIEAHEESTRKMCLRRLQMCRDLCCCVLENKERDR